MIKLISKESAFMIFYYIIACDGMVSKEETEKLDEIGFELFGDVYTDNRDAMIAECEKKTAEISDDPDETFDILSDYIDEALNNTTEVMEKGIPSRLLIWNLLMVAHSDSNYDQNEKRLLRKINRRVNLGDSVLFEMEQYISTVQTIDAELERLNDSMEPYKLIRPIVDELENRRDIIKQAAVTLISDELLDPVEKLAVKDDVIDKAQAVIKEKTDPMMQKVNEQTGKVLGEVRKIAAPAAAEAGKKLGKAFIGFGSKLMNRNAYDKDEKE